jgi:glycine/D-amino acid oxidase-like deaminating enzyme
MRSDGEAVQAIQASSAAFLEETLRRLLPRVEFVPGGYASHCVTTRTPTGEVFNGAAALPASADARCGEGIYISAGCNGSGACYAAEWGQNIAELVHGGDGDVPKRPPRFEGGL